MPRATRRVRAYFGWLLATAAVVAGGCFLTNCLVDPLWYLRGNVLTGINYPFNERLAKIVRLLPRLGDKQMLRALRISLAGFAALVLSYAIVMQGTSIYELVSGAYQKQEQQIDA